MSLRQNYSWLRFFNRNGEDLNFSYDAENDKWEGTIYIPKVSTDLIGYEPVYILQISYWVSFRLATGAQELIIA